MPEPAGAGGRARGAFQLACGGQGIPG